MPEILKAFFALLFVLGLISVVGIVLRSWHQGNFFNDFLKKRWKKKQPTNSPLQIIEIKALDPRRRLVLIKNGQRRHLILLSPQGETVIENYLFDESFSDILGGENKKTTKKPQE